MSPSALHALYMHRLSFISLLYIFLSLCSAFEGQSILDSTLPDRSLFQPRIVSLFPLTHSHTLISLFAFPATRFGGLAWWEQGHDVTTKRPRYEGERGNAPLPLEPGGLASCPPDVSGSPFSPFFFLGTAMEKGCATRTRCTWQEETWEWMDSLFPAHE